MANLLKRYLTSSYREGEDSYFIHDGVAYQLDPIFKHIKDFPIVEVDMKDLAWNIYHKSFDDGESDKVWSEQEVAEYWERVEKADYTVPLITLRDEENIIYVLDGNHRLAKAVRDNVRKLPCRFVTLEDIEPFRREV